MCTLEQDQGQQPLQLFSSFSTYSPSVATPAPSVRFDGEPQSSRFGNMGALSSGPEESNFDLQHQRVFETSKSGILIVDARTGIITDANRPVQEMLGYSHGELCGLALWSLARREDVGAAQRAFQEVLSKYHSRRDDLPLVTKCGSSIAVEVLSDLFWVDGQRAIQCDIREIPSRKDMSLSEDRVRQARKMEAVGQLAGGLAHDFNNVLGVILGYCEILQREEALPESSRQMIQAICCAGSAAKDLTQSLLGFSRRAVLHPVPMDLNRTVKRMQAMLSRLIGEGILVQGVLGADLGTIKADPSQMDLMLINLAINARDAMPNGGRLVIETANIQVNENEPAPADGMKPGNYVMLATGDTGIGMDAETQAHIFEPFFSTKPAGKGTGLGLSNVLDIVRQSGGAISVESQPGKGATFRVFFPCMSQVLAASPELGKSACLCGGAETILLVDDAEGLRGVTRRLLEDSGYTVLDCGDPSEALRLAETYPGPLPLLITDVCLPGFGGPALAERIAAIRPEMRVIYASGYSHEQVMSPNSPDDDCVFLEKPFRREELLTKVRQRLDSCANLALQFSS